MAVLLLRLAGPLQSWGMDSKFEVRKTNREPTKSGVIGLIAAALGLRRDDASTLEKLNALTFAVRVDQEGELLSDYHTASTPKDRQEGKTTYITRRYYLADAVFLAGLESEDRSFLLELQEALAYPAFPLFLGRRACPPTAPLCLGVREGSLLEALSTEPSQVAPWRRRGDTSLRVVMDAADEEPGAPQRDLAISFSPVYRRYGYRRARELYVRPASDALRDTAHDPFEELR